MSRLSLTVLRFDLQVSSCRADGLSEESARKSAPARSLRLRTRDQGRDVPQNRASCVGRWILYETLSILLKL